MPPYEKSIQVTCPRCDSTFDEKEVEFINISEDMECRDILTFKCSTCGEIVDSLRRG